MSLPLNSTKALAVTLALLALLVLAAARTASVSAASVLVPQETAAATAAVPAGPTVHTFAFRRLLPPAAAPARAPLVHVTAAAAVHSGPGSRYLAIAATEPGEQYLLLGKSADGRWWRIDFGGQPAWLSATAAQPTTAPIAASLLSHN
jgi:hypothetical protein